MSASFLGNKREGILKVSASETKPPREKECSVKKHNSVTVVRKSIDNDKLILTRSKATPMLIHFTSTKEIPSSLL